jgi:hypothetical protein
MSIRQTIIGVVTDVASGQGRHLPALTDEVLLLNMDIDSLCMTSIVAQLEGLLELDPFSAADDGAMPSTFGEYPLTFGEFVGLYENAAARSAKSSGAAQRPGRLQNQATGAAAPGRLHV